MLISKDKLISWLARLILEQIQNGGIEKIADLIESFLPTIREWKYQLFDMLRRKALSTTGFELDDAVVAYLDNLIERLIGHCESCTQVPK